MIQAYPYHVFPPSRQINKQLQKSTGNKKIFTFSRKNVRMADKTACSLLTEIAIGYSSITCMVAQTGESSV